MKAEIISIGTELLLGQSIDTNSAYISRELARIGIDVYYHTTVGDNNTRLYETIKTAMKRSDIVITTGGLGPTIDDVTLDAAARISDRSLILNANILCLIKKHFSARHIKMPKINIRQAYIPKGAVWLKNNSGTAPGLIIKKYKKTLICLPGPDSEMIPMLEKKVLMFLKKISPFRGVILTRTIKTTGLSESQVHQKVKGFLKLSGHTTMGIYVKPGQVELKITSKAENAIIANKHIDAIEQKLRKRLGNLICGIDHQGLEETVLRLLKSRTIAVAESCTGGLISDRITNVPGASKNLILSVVAYSNESKINLLRVSAVILNRYGAVSAQTARAMAKNIRIISGADIGLSVTGIAGPGGGKGAKPVGLVYTAISDKEKTYSKRHFFIGSRKHIKFRYSQAALDMARTHIIQCADS
ncbi:MAG: competence/damage-inducible protein A [Candidatus Omnitrophica bacterium]|nr:competence/damage-inducible protein A [Candidatus Omnitrophota bacterium]